MEINERFRVLSTVAKVLQAIGWITVFIGAILLIVTGADAASKDRSWAGMTLLSSIGVFVVGFVVVALAELIGVLFAIEKNTRK